MSLSRLLCAALAVVFACSAGALYTERAEAAEGLASWYAPQNAGEFAATHDTLPIGTQLTVSYDDRWVVVTVTGRGPGAGGRDLDISQAPAQHLGLTKVGVDFVEYTYSGDPVASDSAPSEPAPSETAAPQPVSPQPIATQPVAASGWLAVQPGDTLDTLAARHGVPVESLAAANGMAVGDMLYAGDTLANPQTGTPQTGTPQAAAPQSGSAVGSASSSPGYPGAAWYPASDYGNYTAASRPTSNPVNKIVVHTTQGSYESAMNWFQDPTSGVSAHYTVRASDGVVGQSVSEQNIAHHAGNWDYNQTSVGIEHEGFVEDPYAYTDAMYQSSAQLGAYLANKYEIPINRRHVIGHSEVPGATHTDPGPYWDWNTYLGYMQQYAGGTSATTW